MYLLALLLLCISFSAANIHRVPAGLLENPESYVKHFGEGLAQRQALSSRIGAQTSFSDYTLPLQIVSDTYVDANDPNGYFGDSECVGFKTSNKVPVQTAFFEIEHWSDEPTEDYYPLVNGGYISLDLDIVSSSKKTDFRICATPYTDLSCMTHECECDYDLVNGNRLTNCPTRHAGGFIGSNCIETDKYDQGDTLSENLLSILAKDGISVVAVQALKNNVEGCFGSIESSNPGSAELYRAQGDIPIPGSAGDGTTKLTDYGPDSERKTVNVMCNGRFTPIYYIEIECAKKNCDTFFLNHGVPDTGEGFYGAQVLAEDYRVLIPHSSGRGLSEPDTDTDYLDVERANCDIAFLQAMNAHSNVRMLAYDWATKRQQHYQAALGAPLKTMFSVIYDAQGWTSFYRKFPNGRVTGAAFPSVSTQMNDPGQLAAFLPFKYIYEYAPDLAIDSKAWLNLSFCATSGWETEVPAWVSGFPCSDVTPVVLSIGRDYAGQGFTTLPLVDKEWEQFEQMFAFGSESYNVTKRNPQHLNNDNETGADYEVERHPIAEVDRSHQSAEQGQREWFTCLKDEDCSPVIVRLQWAGFNDPPYSFDGGSFIFSGTSTEGGLLPDFVELTKQDFVRVWTATMHPLNNHLLGRALAGWAYQVLDIDRGLGAI